MVFLDYTISALEICQGPLAMLALHLDKSVILPFPDFTLAILYRNKRELSCVTKDIIGGVI
ncbi:MAG: hypothetical protein LBU35_01145 [Holosporales bacterium]|nr:hypothetical protein [Holosporales bacterium]